ncbi:biosynthetic-type acetolactate synthase large subunit [Saccharospirillum mangrovi]|uniref:biosynthetic-type acetolactate synthase large subunit n=1 Tax=Saccharospirillum mangrovi TaxID=2161747 RepID=UPI000D3B3669|nr:biosynthetic-type acetolactate synthase large subunit [Saccharospirillum mangrovi]
METMTGAELTVALLERQGIRHLAGMPGGTNLPLYDALGRSRIHSILARHEQGAGFIAQGMARASGQPAVCLATSGPGATNLLTALADAKLDSIPIVCITGQVPIPLIGTDAFQEVDICAMSQPVTKQSIQVRSVKALLSVIPDAFALAMSGRPGPVLIDIPKDVQLASIEVDAWPEPGRAVPPLCANANVIDTAAQKIIAAQRPILYLGGGVIHADAGDLAMELAQRCDLPTVMTLMALGVMPQHHSLSLGMLGMHGAAATNHALHQCDLLITIGARFDDRATGKLEAFCPDAEVIHLDIDAREIHKLRRADVPLAGDARATLAQLLERLPPLEHPHWQATIADIKTRHPEPNWPTQLNTPQGLIKAVAERLGPDALVTTDVGQHQMWTAQLYPFLRPRQFLTSGGLGTMGFGLPAAIGAALAEPERTVVCFSGDGSILLNLQELATAADLPLNIKVVVMNNGGLGLVRQQQDLFYRGQRVSSTLRNPDFCQLAEGFGWSTQDLSDADNALSCLHTALDTPGLQLIHAPIDSDARVYPMVPPGHANHQMLVAEPV